MFVKLLISAVVCLAVSEARLCETLQSAFSVHDTTYLVTDQRVLILAEHKELPEAELTIPVRVEGQTAAVSLDPHEHHYVLISCTGDRTFSEDGQEVEGQPPFPDTGFPRIDAATVRRDEVFFFAGNNFRTYNFATGRLSPVFTTRLLDLPGDIDAAWHDNFYHATMVVKGDQVYLADDSDTSDKFVGPLPLDLYMDLPSLTLCPSRRH